MSGGPLRIIHCLRAPVGGLFRHVCDLAEAQAERGHLVGIIADASTGGEAADQRFARLKPLCQLGIERFAMTRLPGPGDLAVASRVQSVARRGAPDILHGHGAKGGLYARIAGSRLKEGRKPVRAYTPHGGSLHYSASSPTGFVYLAVERFLARRTDVFLFESQYGRSVFERKVCVPDGIVRVVHNGVSRGEFSPVRPAPDAADFVFVGELRQLKGIDTLLEALALLDPGADGPRAAIVGAGADRNELVKLADDLGLSKRVTFPGPMPAREAFALGKCIVVPSRAESLPYIVLEAAAAALPMVATEVGGIPEIFGEQSSRLVPPADPPALAAAMRRILDDPDQANTDAGALATRVAEHFSVQGMADQILNAYLSAL
jgi:glycosyltransferase involved in cell wall biosynthesis